MGARRSKEVLSVTNSVRVGMAAKLAEEVGHDFAVSVTHTKEYAQAVVIAEGNGKTLL